MHAPAVAAGLRRLGHDAVAAAEQHDLRAASDAELFAWAAVQGRCVVTEDVTDFCRLLDDAREAGQPRPIVVFTTSKTFPRARSDPGPLIRALHAWLRATPHRRTCMGSGGATARRPRGSEVR